MSLATHRMTLIVEPLRVFGKKVSALVADPIRPHKVVWLRIHIWHICGTHKPVEHTLHVARYASVPSGLDLAMGVCSAGM